MRNEAKTYFAAGPCLAPNLWGACHNQCGVQSTVLSIGWHWLSTGICVLRFDNEAGKGDHKHAANTGEPYKFNGPEALLEDFWSEVDKWRR